jgi:endoglucanase
LASICLTVLAPTAAAASVRISGHRLIGVDGHALRLIGVNRSGTEYACTGPDGAEGFGYAIFQGPVDAASTKALRSWHVNAVALPLNEACWLGGYAGLKPEFTGKPYRDAIAAYVKRLGRSGIYVVLRLSGAAPGDHAFGSDQISSSEVPMADADHSIDFWASVAARFRRSSRVLFHTFDEPHDVDWACLRDGCTATDSPDGQQRFSSYQTAGNQAIVDAIRNAGGRQPILRRLARGRLAPLRPPLPGDRRRLRRHPLRVDLLGEGHGRDRLDPPVVPRVDLEHGAGLRRLRQRAAG